MQSVFFEKDLSLVDKVTVEQNSCTIKMLVMDVDGTLTDGALVYGTNDTESKMFSVKDGLILKILSRFNIELVFLTGRKSEVVSRRAADIDAVAVQGIDDKVSALKALFTERNMEPGQCAYIGDDLNDYAAMKLCGFKACPNDAVTEIRELSDYVSPYSGGHGAVRDICEHILRREGIFDKLLEYYGIV